MIVPGQMVWFKSFEAKPLDIYEYLCQHASGAANAIRGSEIAAWFGIDIRQVADIAKRLLERDRLLVGSCSRGYFVIVTEEDVRVALGKLEPMGVSIFRRCAILKKMSYREYTDQILLRLEEEE
jgi:hypothetical protein